MKKILVFITFWVLSGVGGRSQENYPVRAELPVTEGDAPFHVLTLDRMGVLVVMKQNDLFASRPQRTLYFYDENLRQRWRSDLETESYYKFLGYSVEQDSIRFVLTTLPDKMDAPAFLEISVCMADGYYRKKYRSIDVSSLVKGSIPAFRIEEGCWRFLALNRSEYACCRIEAGTDTLYRYPAVSAKDYDWCDWQTDTAGNIYLLFRDSKAEEEGLFLNVYSAQGEEIERQTIVSPRKGMRLIDARMVLLGERDLFLGGSWNMVQGKQTISAYDRGTETMGLFAMRYRSGEPVGFWMGAYLDYPLLDTLLSSGEQYKFAQARQKSNGRVILPDYLCGLRLQAGGGRFRLTGEIYERVINTTTEVSYDFYGRMMPYTQTTFEGYRYQNAFYSVFDSSAANMGGSVFDIEQPVLYGNLTPVTAVAEDTSGALLYGYNSQGIVYYRSTRRGRDGVGPVRSFRLAPLVPGDRIQRTWKDGMVEWYPGCFLAYGYQQIHNARRKGKSRQNVFYMNKVVVDGGNNSGTMVPDR